MSDDTHLRRASWPPSLSRPVASPLHQSVVYASPDPDALDAHYRGQEPGYTYSREGHPNATVLAGLIDRLEGAPGGAITGSGMAAITAVLLGVPRSGDHVIGADQLYGRSLRLMTEDLPRLGIDTSLVDTTKVENLARAMRPETKLILVETLSNPTLRVADLQAIAALARDRGILLAVDNTFTTPRGFRPLASGADITLHSVTKLLAGHADAMLGYVAARDPEVQARLDTVIATFGLTPSPFDCWLAERGLYSFDLRYRRACETAARLADALAGTRGVKRVIYPGRPDHPDHATAMTVFAGQGGNMVSFLLDGGRAAANALTRAAPGLAFAPTLGDIATTLSHPPSSSHRAMSPEARQAIGITEGFFRVSVGVEEAEALIGELTGAIRAAVRT